MGNVGNVFGTDYPHLHSFLRLNAFSNINSRSKNLPQEWIKLMCQKEIFPSSTIKRSPVSSSVGTLIWSPTTEDFQLSEKNIGIIYLDYKTIQRTLNKHFCLSFPPLLTTLQYFLVFSGPGGVKFE